MNHSAQMHASFHSSAFITAPGTPLSARTPVMPPSLTTTVTPPSLMTTASIVSPAPSVTSSVSCHGTTPDSAALRICLFNAHSVCPDEKTDPISDYILEHDFDITEAWLNQHGHEPKCKQLSPPGFRLWSLPRLSRGGGIDVIYKDILRPLLSFRESSPFAARSFESVEFIFKHPGQSFPASTDLLPADKTNSQPHSFTKNFLLSLTTTASALANFFCWAISILTTWIPVTLCIRQLLNNHNLSQLVLEPAHKSDHIIDWLIACESDNLISSVSVTDQLESDHKAVLACLNLSKPFQNSRLIICHKL